MSPIAFSLVPANVRVPGIYAEFDPSKAVQGLAPQEHRILVFGQRLSTGTKAALTLSEVPSGDLARTWYGNGSMLHHMIERLKAVNSSSRVFACPLDDNGAGVAAIGSYTFVGTASSAGTLYLLVGGRAVQVGVAAGSTPSAIATAVAAALEATTSPKLAAAAAVDGVDPTKVNVTYRHKGLCGNDLDLRVNYNPGEELPEGVTVTIVQPTGGTANPTLAAALAVIGDEAYTEIVMPYTDATNLTALETELADRWGPIRPIDGHAYACMDATSGSLTSFGNERNSPHVTTLGIKNCPTPTYEIASVLAGIISAWAAERPQRPPTGLTLTGVLAPAPTDRFTWTERNTLLADGISTVRIGGGGAVEIERLITMWQVNPSGAADESYLDLNTILVLSYLRYSLRIRVATRFQQSWLAKDGTRFGAGLPVITPKSARAQMAALFDEWEKAGLVEDAAQFAKDMIVEINGTNPVRLDILLPPNIVNPLLIVAVKLEFRR